MREVLSAFALLVVCVAGVSGTGLALGAEFDLQSLPVGQRVEIDGKWDGTILVATKVAIETPDPEVEIKGFAARIDTVGRTIELPPFTVEVPEDADIDDDHDIGDSYHLHELEDSWRLKIEGEWIGPHRFRAVEIDVDRKRSKRLLELEGPIGAVGTLPDGRVWYEVLGVRCVIVAGTEFDPGDDRETRASSARRVIDDDDRRKQHRLRLYDWLSIGGEAQVDFEYEDDYDLDKHNNGDIFALDTSLNLEATIDVTREIYAFVKGRSAKAYVLFDENRDKDFDEETKLEEMYVHWVSIFGAPVGLQMGRQDFDEPREWIYDENLDAMRVHWYPGPFRLEYSWAGYIADAPREDRDRLYHIFLAEWEHHKDCTLGMYVVDVLDDSDVDDSPFFVGFRALGEPTDSLMYWLDYAYLDGVNNLQEINAHGGDVGFAYQFTNWPLRPYLFASYGFGSGDSRAAGDTDRNFRQTGLQDNNDRTFGVASYRYYGELLRPELSNMHIHSVGVGIRPQKWWSVDFVYHYYRQDHRSTVIRDSVLRASPSGNARTLGEEFDIVVGFRDLFDQFDIEIDFGYFDPGRAFEVNDHPALWTGVQIEWNF